MRSLFATLCTIVVFVFFAGCTTTPTSSVKPSKPVSTESEKSSKHADTAATKSPDMPLAEGEYRLKIESAPDEAMVVVNGIPVGRTPRIIEIAGTKHGFFRDQVSLKVRFISIDAAHPSQTVEEMLTPLDRIPATVKFTPAGATRVARKTS